MLGKQGQGQGLGLGQGQSASVNTHSASNSSRPMLNSTIPGTDSDPYSLPPSLLSPPLPFFLLHSPALFAATSMSLITSTSLWINIHRIIWFFDSLPATVTATATGRASVLQFKDVWFSITFIYLLFLPTPPALPFLDWSVLSLSPCLAYSHISTLPSLHSLIISPIPYISSSHPRPRPLLALPLPNTRTHLTRFQD